MLKEIDVEKLATICIAIVVITFILSASTCGRKYQAEQHEQKMLELQCDKKYEDNYERQKSKTSSTGS